MNKLEERFKGVLYFCDENCCYENGLDIIKATYAAAKEAKQLAIEFHGYLLRTDNYGKTLVEPLFDKFLEEYYAKITDK